MFNVWRNLSRIHYRKSFQCLISLPALICTKITVIIFPENITRFFPPKPFTDYFNWYSTISTNKPCMSSSKKMHKGLFQSFRGKLLMEFSKKNFTQNSYTGFSVIFAGISICISSRIHSLLTPRIAPFVLPWII